MNVSFPFRWLILLGALLALPARAQELTIAMLEGEGVLDLVTRAVLTEAYGKLDTPLRFREVPAPRAMAESASGMVDGELHRIAGLSSVYPDLVQVGIAVNWFDAVVVSRAARFVPKGWNSLRPYTIGYHRGIQTFERGTSGMRIDPAPTNELMLLKLHSGRTDIALMSDVEARQLLAKLQVGGLRILAPPIARIQLYHYVHKRNADIVPKLEAVLKRMAADGTIATIRERTLIKAGVKPRERSLAGRIDGAITTIR